MIAIGCDHGGYQYKEQIREYLKKKGYELLDCGTYSEDSCDYPVYAKKVAEAVQSGSCEKGILICGTGVGVSITANKFKGIRCALCENCFTAQATREHNDANILAMGARTIGIGLAMKITDIFLETPFSEDERHIRRVKMIEE